MFTMISENDIKKRPLKNRLKSHKIKWKLLLNSGNAFVKSSISLDVKENLLFFNN